MPFVEQKLYFKNFYNSMYIFLRSIFVYTVASDNCNKRQLTYLLTYLIVVQARLSSVEVYDKVTMKRQSSFEISDMKYPYDVVGHKEFIFVSERNEESIHKIHLTEKTCRTWIVGYSCMALSITHEDQWLAAYCAVNKPQFLARCNNQTGSRIQKINLQGNMNIRPSVAYTSENFLIVHGRPKSCGHWGDRLKLVCVVDGNGRVIKSYGGTWGRTSGMLNEPIRLAVNKSGFIFVLDHTNDNVIMLNSNLEFVREVIPSTTLCRPYRMCLDNATGRLYISDEKDKSRIICFDSDTQ